MPVPRRLTEAPDTLVISTQVLPFEDTHACLLQSLKDYLDTHAEDEFESKIMLKIGLSRRPGNREIGDCYPSTPSRRRRVTKRSPAGGHRVDSNSADYFRMMPDGVCARRPTFLRRGDGVRGGTATLPYAITRCAGHLQDVNSFDGEAAGPYL